MIVHTYPVDDLRPHVVGGCPLAECWCHPRVYDAFGGIHIVHNSLDRREEYEQGRKPS